MMWKESYRLGVDLIDEQHFELFKMVENLLNTFETDKNWDRKEDYIAAISFMKDYVVKHFQEEEEYQASIQYSNIENHINEHRNFTNTILDYEKKFIATNYDIKLVKEFAGTLVSWLIYHVVETDQRIVNGVHEAEEKSEKSYTECFSTGASQVFERMFGIEEIEISEAPILNHPISGDIFSKIEFVGDLNCEVIFSYPKELAFQLMKIMTFMDTNEIDEIVCSAMAEVSNIISGNVTTALLNQNCNCDIRPPVVTVGTYVGAMQNPRAISIHTGIGTMEIVVSR
ncbi:bacteriohemerythrin [Hydrogenoanaerobacterium sp.]|uniref:bacteriohemerythrin n=1 Tax=Hydrogenoanaerobacterium sp. TaxID=2953763 RepID=UPI0028A26339|nr:bacteriohemerythrin [Hydrogenoanaerobacterium sp.]